MCGLQEWCQAEGPKISRQGRSRCDDDASSILECDEGEEARSEEKDSKQKGLKAIVKRGTTIQASTTLGTYAIEGTSWSGSQEGTSTYAEFTARADEATTKASTSSSHCE